MRVILISPGTGNFHCGSCLRDQALARALLDQGHDAIVVPMYLPPVTDGAPVAEGRIFFGGINAYLQQQFSVFRKTPRWVDALFDHPALLKAAAAMSGMTRAKDVGEMMISMLQGEEGRQAKELEHLADYLATLRERDPQPMVVCLSNVMLSGLARRIRETLDCPVVCTMQGEDTFIDALPRDLAEAAWDLLRERARQIDAFIAVSRYYGGVMMNRLALHNSKVHVIHNGIDATGYVPAASPPATPTIGYLARMCHAKGLSTLVDAFCLLKQRDTIADLKLVVGGAMVGPDPKYVEGLKQQLAAAGCAEHVTWRPNLTLEQKRAFFQNISVFSVPATYGEAFGLYLLEAAAAGVPVVQPEHAAFPELISELGAGTLCAPHDPAALADALEATLASETARSDARRARDVVLERFTHTAMATRFAAVCDTLLTPTGASVSPAAEAGHQNPSAPEAELNRQ